MTGTYYAAAELSRRGFIVSMTSRNAKGIDLFASAHDAKKPFAVQVKTTTYKQNWWLVDKKPFSSTNLIYIFVRLSNEKPDFYIVASKRISKEVQHKKYGKAYWHWFYAEESDKDNLELFN